MKPIIAVIQMCSSSNVDENLNTVEKLINEAVKHHAKMVVLPEMFAVMGEKASDKVDVKEVLGEGKIQRFLSAQAREHNIWIVGGTIPIAGDDKNKIRAACLVYNNEGKMVGRYDKIHLFDVSLSEKETYKESETTEPGDQIVVIDTPFGKLGLAVCYDIRFPELFRALFDKGAEMIALPAAFTVPTGEAHWEVLARARAIETFSYIIGACQGGTHANGRQTFGHSLIITPWGNIAAKQNNTEEGITYAEIDLDKVHEARRKIPIHAHRKLPKS